MKTPIALLTMSLAWALGIGGALPCTYGQAKVEVALPSGPLWAKRAPESAQWVVTFKAQGAMNMKEETGKNTDAASVAPQADGADYEKVVTKSRDTYRIKMVTGSRYQLDKWCFDGLQVTKMSNAEKPVISTSGNPDPYYANFSRTDFEGFDWISPQSYLGMKTVGNVECLHFKGTITTDRAGETVPVQAWIHAKTRLPVSLQVGESLTTYAFANAPDAALAPPEEIKAIVDRWQKRQQQAKLKPPA